MPIFKLKDKTRPKRIILECDSKSSFSLKYDKNNKRLIFDQLVPIKKELKGMHEYYIPEGTYNSFNYENGKWILNEDIDARNKQTKTNKKKSPKMGLIK